MADYGELGYLLAQRRAPQNAGAAGLGAMLAGGDPLRREKIASEAQFAGARMADVLAQARQRQYDEAEKQHQRDSRRHLVESVGKDNPLGAQFLDSYENPEQAAQALLHLQNASAGKQAIDLANAPNVDYNHINALKIATAANPTELQRNLGDGSYTNNAYRTDSPVNTSAIGDAFIGEKRALAGEHQAQADRARAGIGADKAANYEIVDTPLGKVRVNKLDPNDTKPVLLNGEPVAKPATGKFTDAERLSLFGGEADPQTGKAVVDPVKLGKFFAKQRELPGKTDPEVFNAMRDQEVADNTKAANTPSADMQAQLASAPLGDSFAPAKQPQFIEGKVYVDGNGKKAIYRNGQFIEQ